MDITNYDNWKLSNGQEDEKVFSDCEECGREIYVGDDYYSIMQDNVHEECLEDYAKGIADKKTAE
jgi:hypothetical protein